MDEKDSAIGRRAAQAAGAFGSLIRTRRRALAMSQDHVALATGVGRRFIVDLEAGKTSCQLGRSLVVAEAVGLRLADIVNAGAASDPAAAADLPDLSEAEDEPDG